VSVDGQPITLSSNWEFAFGIAFDRTNAVRVIVNYTDGENRVEDLVPVARQYEQQRVDGLPPRTVEPLPEDKARIDAEHALVAEARKTDSDETWFTEPFRWPARGRISGVYGSRRVLNGIPGTPHFGVDIAAPTGAPIRAPASGRVLIAQDFFLEGGFTLLDHGQGVFTGYMHQSDIRVSPGEVVLAGQRIGSVGATGRATGPHLHWSMNWFQTRLDPSLSARSPEPERA
jgi:murein DD-endopeptidase MepM/ murein hydrolase activator NlpD